MSSRFYGGSYGGHQRTLIRCLYLVSDHRHLLVRSRHRRTRLFLSYNLSLRMRPSMEQDWLARTPLKQLHSMREVILEQRVATPDENGFLQRLEIAIDQRGNPSSGVAIRKHE